IAHVLLRHRKVRLVDQPPELTLRNGKGLLSVDLLDQWKFRRGQTGEREATAARAHGHSLTLTTEGHLHFLRERAKDVEQFTSGYGDVAALLDVCFSTSDELDFQVGAREAQFAVSCGEQDVRQHWHRLPALDHTDDALKGSEEILASGCQLHIFPSSFLDLNIKIIVTVEPVNSTHERRSCQESRHYLAIGTPQLRGRADRELCTPCA